MDPIDAAIAAAEQPQPIPMVQRQLTITTTGRPFVLAHPEDLTEGELFEVIGWMATALRGELAKRHQRSPAARILVPSGVVRPT